MKAHNIFILSLIALLATSSAFAQISREQYIEQYKKIALEDQKKFGIPASIKMAQALLESSDGNSRLATLANHHFGIKCKSTWKGETLSHDDDALGECFRKYSSAEESFADHSKFLSEGERYKFLFDIPQDDYTAWAYGLKQAGYATNPQYAQLLIDIIEKNNLQNLAVDSKKKEPKQDKSIVSAAPAKATITVVGLEVMAESVFNISDYAVYKKQKGNHSVYINNNSRFVVMADSESLETLSENVKVSEKKLRKYNDLNSNQTIAPNQMVYVKAKKKKVGNGTKYHTVKKGETWHSISQLYAIRLNELCERNKKTIDMALPVGMRLRLK